MWMLGLNGLEQFVGLVIMGTCSARVQIFSGTCSVVCDHFIQLAFALRNELGCIHYVSYRGGR